MKRLTTDHQEIDSIFINGVIEENRELKEKRVPKCYSEDVGGGCRYLAPDCDDEPIDRCKKCPLCYGDKARHRQPPNDPLTLEELRKMNGEPVWVERHSHFDCTPHWALVHVHRSGDVYLTERNCGQILFIIGDKVCCIQGTRWTINISSPHTVRCGCQNHTWQEWHDHYAEISKEHGADDVLEEYIRYFNLLCEMYGHEDCKIEREEGMK